MPETEDKKKTVAVANQARREVIRSTIVLTSSMESSLRSLSGNEKECSERRPAFRQMIKPNPVPTMTKTGGIITSHIAIQKYVPLPTLWSEYGGGVAGCQS